MRAAVITPGTSTLYRVWLRGRVVCATNDADTAIRARRAAMCADAESLFRQAHSLINQLAA